MTMSSNRREPLFDVRPLTGASIEVFYADGLATFGRSGAGWFYWSRRQGSAPDGPIRGRSLRATQPICTRRIRRCRSLGDGTRAFSASSRPSGCAGVDVADRDADRTRAIKLEGYLTIPTGIADTSRT